MGMMQGINPAIELCFWCNEAKGVALLPGDKQIRQAVLNYEPCDDCQAQRGQGFTCIEVTSAPLPIPDIGPNLRPTGRWWVTREKPFPCEGAIALIDTDVSGKLFP